MLKNCFVCNKPPSDLICIPPGKPQYCYYVCGRCGKKTRDIESANPDNDNTWNILSAEWNDMN